MHLKITEMTRLKCVQNVTLNVKEGQAFQQVSSLTIQMLNITKKYVGGMKPNHLRIATVYNMSLISESPERSM